MSKSSGKKKAEGEEKSKYTGSFNSSNPTNLTRAWIYYVASIYKNPQKIKYSNKIQHNN